MLYICNVCSKVHTRQGLARECAEICLFELEGDIFYHDDGLKSEYECPVCNTLHHSEILAKSCMFDCYALENDKFPYEDIFFDELTLCFVCTHSDEFGKVHHPCPQHVFCEEMKSQCANFEPDVRTFGTKLATDFRLHNLGMEG